MPTLEELMAENPSLKIEIDARDKKNFNKGRQSGVDQIRAVNRRIRLFLTSESYPAGVHELACKVLVGEAEFAALEGAITLYDAQEERRAAEAAQEESESIPETPPQQGSNGDHASCNPDHVIAHDKVILGREDE